jgi:hypothetical protein
LAVPQTAPREKHGGADVLRFRALLVQRQEEMQKMRWTQEQYNEYQRKRAKADSYGVCAPKPERPAGVPLERAGKREAPGGTSPQGRFLVHFRCYSVRPLDWDNYRFKDLQDMLCVAGLLPDDNWQILEGHVSSHKAASPIFERTEIEITRL